MFKKFTSAFLAFVLSFGGSLVFCGEAYAAAQPQIIEQSDSYTIWQNADGTRTVRMEYEREDLADPSNAESWVDRGGSWSNAGAVAETELQKTHVENETLVTLRKDGTSISFAPIRPEEPVAEAQPIELPGAQQLNANQTASNVLRIALPAQSQPSRIEGVLRGTARSRSAGAVPAVFEGLFDENTRVELAATSGGIKEDIVVDSYTGNHVYAYQVSLSGLRAELRGQEVWMLDESGRDVAVIKAPNMRDANGAYSEDIAVSLEAVEGGYRLTYVPSDAWMQGAAYPVTIDPTAHYINEAVSMIGISYVSSAEPDKNFQNQQYQSYKALVGRNNSSNHLLYVAPVLRGNDLATAGGSPFPTDSNILIQNAHWRVSRSNETNGNGGYTVHMLEEAWNPYTVTFNSRPKTSSKVYATGGLNEGNKWTDFDLTEMFSEWFNNINQKPMYGLMLQSATNSGRLRISIAEPTWSA